MGNTTSKHGGKKLKHLHLKSKSKEPEKSKQPEKKSKEPEKPKKNSRLIKTEQRLGSNEQEVIEQKLLAANPVPRAGNRGSETSNQSESARQAVARAAEERYKKNLEKLAGSKERLQAKKNLSKLDKNL